MGRVFTVVLKNFEKSYRGGGALKCLNFYQKQIHATEKPGARLCNKEVSMLTGGILYSYLLLTKINSFFSSFLIKERKKKKRESVARNGRVGCTEDQNNFRSYCLLWNPLSASFRPILLDPYMNSGPINKTV